MYYGPFKWEGASPAKTPPGYYCQANNEIENPGGLKMIYKNCNSVIDLKRVIAAKYVLFGVAEERRGLEVYLEAGFKIDVLPEDVEEFLKAWADCNKVKETTAILIPDSEDQEAPESFGGLRSNCSGCGKEFILNSSDERFLSRRTSNPKERSILFKCYKCGKEQFLTLKDFK